ncbi:MAG: transmembrane anchor protein [Pseudomonadota bacterium]|jgi:hypothetical protein|nr:transmembrane anchor protein [Pseudomonadota bacterium]QKK04256.1 MAG: transmembrane anchor protein [Pseudomonadota bacterium]
MYNKNTPTQAELPSTGKLIKSTIIAAVTAGFLLVTVVMPAEYGIDPTGIGKTIGLKKMGDIKVSLAEEAAADKAKSLIAQDGSANSTIVEPTPEAAPAILVHEMQVTLSPDEGTEIKVAMAKGAKVTYSWWTDGGKANFDIHGDSKELKIDYHNYEKGSKKRVDNATIVADFDGSHGWFWRNRTSKIMTITLQTKGEYTKIQHMK